MNILRGLDFQIKNSAVSLGKFDGIHQGHRLLLQEIKKQKDLIPTVFTFDVTAKDREKLQGVTPRKLIYSQEEKQVILSEMGIEREILFPFNEETRCMRAEEFIKDYLVKKIDARFVCVGEDFRFGKDREGNVGMLKKYAQEYDYDIKIFHKLTSGDDIISSTLVRKKIEEGDIKRANELLGKSYFIKGKVIHGKALGRTIDMPTANIVPDAEKVLLPFGVYATTVILDGKVYPAVTNIGKKPTIGEYHVGVESCILGFDKNIYGKDIIVQFHEFLRPEKKFPGIEELKNQMEHDKMEAAKILKKYNF